MELNLIVPVPEGIPRQTGDEEINGRLWRVTGPHDHQNISKLKFNCISYVWGKGTVPQGSFFDCKREISDQTRPALTAAVKAAEKLYAASNEEEEEKVEAFWIDAICIPQLEVLARFKTLESMGFIYHAASNVIIVLAPFVFEAIYTASSKMSPDPLSLPQMQLLEADPWISRVWTYQELINGHSTYFTAPHSSQVSIIRAENLFNCVGFSLARWKSATRSGALMATKTFPNLSNLEDTISDTMVNRIFEIPAVCILSNMAMRAFDPNYPMNRLLACLGALTTQVSWGPASMTMQALSEKFMGICEGKGDYSFIFTTDKRMDVLGKRWRPNPEQPEGKDPAHLVPVINWYGNMGETQQGHVDGDSLLLTNVVPVQRAERMNAKVEKEIGIFLYGDRDPTPEGTGRARLGVIHQDEMHGSQFDALHHFLVEVGFSGCPEYITCDEGVFFAQESLQGRQSVELFAAQSLPYLFGYAGLAQWNDGVARYCAGVFIGIVKKENARSVRVV